MYLEVLKNRNILYYLIGAGVSNSGNVIAGLAFMFMAYELTESGLYTTVVVISQVAPYLLFGLIGGVIADWVNKKSLLIWIDLIRVPIILSLVIVHQLELLQYWHLIVISFMIQSLGCFFNPAHRAILPIITKQEERTTANSLLDTVTRGVQVLGPIVSVGLMKTIGVIQFFTFDAMTYLLSAFFINKIHFSEERQQSKEQRKISAIFRSIQEFVIWMRSNFTIRTLFILTFTMVFFNTWVWQVGLLLQLVETLPSGKEWYSILLGWYGAAVILINLTVPFLWKKFNLKIYLIGSIVWGAGVLLLGLASNVFIYFVGVFVVAIGIPISGLSRVYLIQQLVPSNKLGRGFSFNAVLLYLSNVVSLGFFGLISSFISTHLLFLFCGGMMILGAVIYFLTLLRKERGVAPYSRLNS
jgi:DHA3 family macrolide efflux protein-like MFS transporter